MHELSSISVEERRKVLQEKRSGYTSVPFHTGRFQRRQSRHDTSPVIPAGVFPKSTESPLWICADASQFDCPSEELENLKKKYPEAAACLTPCRRQGLSVMQLYRAGLALLPRFAYGFLNGGSATSYGDEKKEQRLQCDELVLSL